MTSIQALLIVCFLIAAVLGTMAFRSRLAYRLLAVILFLTAAGFVLFPHTTTAIAQLLGVGRGTDLLLYLSLVGGLYAFLLLYLHTRRLERQITELVRAQAMRDAVRPGDVRDIAR